ncbi:hypothetical protein A3K29_03360 [Candidatus Collierbacteria bacterium RIFOXYB2_FULL_46_14]|uniref:Ribosomal RNA large subunit methyltransferase K/L-like methyltransferase domain-containing protein n=1 Tax=Candidatus Collierbacteria bacterium GW2011_GWA2_46_26 TaxID=1618381 RepID=A0A0G1SKF2_9BACT|nr:MAG: hypothetical protein UW29_C0004G0180 [Candidatus Collierbacteria bacterium GW2011_GWC2_44_13]KKU33770.1 MAG: hypothetical protein UX47_C0001G0053 [Candidatus Collierbacteria bacterium GW2011_GWA2_46_26]OGD73157.1 MAG: hypothetical protein A3K29_03360 [Candidatus Collierbacteria bacterium RIFOXYB2_FULL_46_14]OGD76199.1 MAG: hypothetical protein A3K43_03360 [Candidatus Collierbacteria bacterium RIFOXYA2_FULL_46_20]OGD77535.1 MAG: hypothetical protein A3K39_03360 [Candidatus Collierbacteri
MRFILFVGASNTLAESEIETQIKGAILIQPNIYLFESEDSQSAKSLAAKLGCSIKLAQELQGVASTSQSIADLVKSKNFSVTVLGGFKESSRMNQEIKELLQKGRFILPKDQFGLTPVLLSKHKIDEFFVDEEADEVWQTIWSHDFEHWIKKDRRMPYANAKAGILPPKIARSMISLVPLEPAGKLLVDPFCGSGRVLIEAAELGYTIGGADILAEQVKETKANLDFLGFEARLEVLDATHLSDKFSRVDAIVTEPFLGKPNLRPDQIRYLVPGLQKLYLGCLKNWVEVLKPGGYIVIVFPTFDDGKHIYKTSSVIDGKLELSYNLLKRDILYSRPNADVRREIVVLQKK